MLVAGNQRKAPMKRGILASRSELSALKERIGKHPFDTIYETLNRRCSLILEAAPITEAQWRSLWNQGVWGSAVLAARTTQGRIMDLLIAHHIGENSAYRSRAIEELKNLISWTTWVDPCHNHVQADLCTAEAAVAAVVGLDWLWEDLSNSDRLRIIKAIRTKAIEPYLAGVREQAFWYNAYHSWNPVVNGGCALAGLALSDDDPAAAEALRLGRQGLSRFFEAFGREGAWDEGTGYWSHAMRYLLLFGEALSRLLDDQSILHRRGVDATGLFPVYFTPNGYAASFGDYPSVPLYGTFYLLVKHFGLKEVAWWLDNYAFHRDVSTSGWSAAGLAMLFRPVDFETPKVPDLMPLKVFHEIGWAVMADHWPHPGMYVAAKTGDLGANHAHHDMNSIQIQIDREMLLIDIEHPPYNQQYLSEARGEFYEVQACAHNTIVVAERDHLIDAQGSIVEAQSDEAFRWVALDSAEACGEGVHFVRHVVMFVNPGTQEGEMIVVLDELENAAPERVDMYWHTRGKIDLDPKSQSGTITGQRGRLQFALSSTTKATVSTESHSMNSRRTDNILHLSCGVLGRAYFVSVFSRTPVGQIKLAEGNARVTFTCDGRMLRFKTHRHCLQLEQAQSE